MKLSGKVPATNDRARPVRPMLAAKLAPEAVPWGEYVVTPKYDGVRCLITTSGAQTREGLRFKNPELQRQLSLLPAGLDGEVVYGDFNTTVGLVNREINPPEDLSDVNFYVYDYFLGGYDRPSLQRFEMLEGIVRNWRESSSFYTSSIQLRLAPGYIRTLPADGNMRKVLEAYTAAGFEGICLRPADLGYKFGRASGPRPELIALKHFVDFEVRLIDYDLAQENGNPTRDGAFGHAKRDGHADLKADKPMAGSLRGIALNGEFKGQHVKIGVGKLSHVERECIVRRWPEHMDEVFTAQYQPHGSINAPRIPTFQRWREDYEG